MVSVSAIATFDLVAGAVASLGLLYLLYSETFVVHYRRFFQVITLGLLVYAVTGPVIGEFAPAYIHAVHGVAALFITVGLADLIREDARSNVDDFGVLLAAESRDSDTEPGERDEQL